MDHEMPGIPWAEVVARSVRDRQALCRRFSIEEGHIVIRTDELGHTYDVPLTRCSTHAQVLGWSFHLLEKCWADGRLVREFIRIALRINNLYHP